MVLYYFFTIFFETFRPYLIKSYIDLSSRDIRIKISLFVFLFLKIFFRFFLRFFRDFYISRIIICKFKFLAFKSSVFNFKILYDIYILVMVIEAG